MKPASVTMMSVRSFFDVGQFRGSEGDAVGVGISVIPLRWCCCFSFVLEGTASISLSDVIAMDALKSRNSCSFLCARFEHMFESCVCTEAGDQRELFVWSTDPAVIPYCLNRRFVRHAPSSICAHESVVTKSCMNAIDENTKISAT